MVGEMRKSGAFPWEIHEEVGEKLRVYGLELPDPPELPE